MAIRAFFSAFLSTSLPEYSFVIVLSSSFAFVNVHTKNPASAHLVHKGRCGVFGDSPSSKVVASGRHPAPAADKQQGKRKRYEYEHIRRGSRAVENRVVDDLGLHTMRAIAPQVFADCQREGSVIERVSPRFA
jgi:hypothetical protein